MNHSEFCMSEDHINLRLFTFSLQFIGSKGHENLQLKVWDQTFYIGWKPAKSCHHYMLLRNSREFEMIICYAIACHVCLLLFLINASLFIKGNGYLTNHPVDKGEDKTHVFSHWCDPRNWWNLSPHSHTHCSSTWNQQNTHLKAMGHTQIAADLNVIIKYKWHWENIQYNGRSCGFMLLGGGRMTGGRANGRIIQNGH